MFEQHFVASKESLVTRTQIIIIINVFKFKCLKLRGVFHQSFLWWTKQIVSVLSPSLCCRLPVCVHTWPWCVHWPLINSIYLMTVITHVCDFDLMTRCSPGEQERHHVGQCLSEGRVPSSTPDISSAPGPAGSCRTMIYKHRRASSTSHTDLFAVSPQLYLHFTPSLSLLQ